MHIKLQRDAFSLVELSIVLVILGLLTGGILAGQSLIRGAELRSITTEHDRYIAAVGSFRDKYFALPGDMTNATKFWNPAAAPASCAATASTNTTCDGNGDGMVVPNPNSNEIYRFWQQLALAGLIEGSYDGITHGATTFSSTPENSPRGRISNSLWFTYNWTGPQFGQWVFDGDYGNRMSIGAPVANGEPSASLLTAAELWNIDTKMDDGQPARGKVRSQWAGCTDAANSAALNASYSLTNPAKTCFPIFPQAY